MKFIFVRTRTFTLRLKGVFGGKRTAFSTVMYSITGSSLATA